MTTRLLRNELENKKELADVFDRVYEESLKVWKESYLYEYTAHGKEHSEQVERNLDSLTRPLQNSAWRLSAEEIFVLLSATCLHDIGMQRADDPDARKKHAQSAYELILNSHATVSPQERRVTLPIDDTNARIAIANVAKAHWTDYALQLKSEEVITDYMAEGRLKLLGLLLAMADLLDLSPVRAQYFRSIHRLYDLPSVSELHNKMHRLVKRMRILAPKPDVPGALQFRLEWADDSEIVRTMSAWVMQGFHSQWRQLKPALYEASGGTIDWAEPWSHITFNPAEGPVPQLLEPARAILMAERAEQTRINRDAFAERFRGAVTSGDASLFLFPADSDFDWRALSDWCEADARLHENCHVARVNIRPSAPTYFSGIIPQLMEQWGEHLPQCSDDEALKRLEAFVTDDRTPSLISIIRTDSYVGQSLQDLLQILVRRAESTPAPARVCLLLSPGAEGPKQLVGASIIEFDGSSLPREEVEQHLQSRRGYSLQESRDIYETMFALKLTDHPARVYTYIEKHCGL